MKRVVIMLLIGLLYFPVKGQVKAALEFGIGAADNSQTIKVSEYREDINYNPVLLPSFYVGFNVDIRINEKLILNPGVIFTQRGNIAKPQNEKIETVVDFVALPAWVKYKFKNRWLLKAGLEYAYLLKHKTKSTLAYYDGVEEFIIEKRQHDLGLQIGTEFNLNQRLYLDFRFILGVIKQYRPACAPIYIADQDIYIPAQIRSHGTYSRNVYIGMGYRLFNRN